VQYVTGRLETCCLLGNTFHQLQTRDAKFECRRFTCHADVNAARCSLKRDLQIVSKHFGKRSLIKSSSSIFWSRKRRNWGRLLIKITTIAKLYRKQRVFLFNTSTTKHIEWFVKWQVVKSNLANSIQHVVVLGKEAERKTSLLMTKLEVFRNFSPETLRKNTHRFPDGRYSPNRKTFHFSYLGIEEPRHPKLIRPSLKYPRVELNVSFQQFCKPEAEGGRFPWNLK